MVGRGSGIAPENRNAEQRFAGLSGAISKSRRAVGRATPGSAGNRHCI
jgi:hypothetical protein